ncbi:MAG: 4Fe-4S binding protein [Planctomycetota bacterium]
MTATQPPTHDPLAALPRLDRHRPKGDGARRSRMSRRRAYVLIAVHGLIGVHIWHWLSTGRSITPMEPSESMQTFELGRINAGFLLFAGLIASTLIFGRWFCGWACHVVALQDLCQWLLVKARLKPRPVRSRLLVLAPWVVAFHMFAWPHVHHWLDPVAKPMPDEWRWELTTEDLWATFPGPIMAIATFVVVGGLIVLWLGAKGFCTYGCPYGAFFTLADRVAPVRVKVNDACDSCGHCTSVCTSNVRVHEEVAKHKQIVDPGCMKCLDCVSVCPKDALSIGLAAPKPLQTSQQRIRQRADFSWPEEVLMACVAVVAVQWTFRGAWFGEGVPFLMSVGLGAITAVFAMLFVRLLTRPDVTFQHTALKVGGSRTRAGSVALLAIAGWLLFTGHTFVGQRLRADAVERAQAPIRAKIYSPRAFDAEQAAAALDGVEYAAAFALVADPQLRELRALLRGSVDRHADAEAELTALYERYGRLFFDESKMALANYFARRRRLDAAEELLLEVVSDNPGNPAAPRLLAGVRKLQRG